MPNPVCHFAIHAEDCQRAMSFYQTIFGWQFEPWGPPDFWRIQTGQPGVEGALHQRLEPLSGTGIRGFECSISVNDIASISAMITEHGGQITMPSFLIEGVGTVAKFTDTEGNAVSVMQYLPGVFESMGGSS